MALDLNQIKQAIEKPAKKQVISKAVNLQLRLRFHTETNLALSEMGLPATNFLDWVRGILPKDKYNVFLHLFKFPVPTVAVVEDVYRELERVFDSRNASSSYQFTTSELNEDWANYRKNVLNEPEVWKTQAWKKMQVSPNSILVVDLAQEQTTQRPEPYFYWLEIEDVIDYELKPRSCTDFEWLIFKQPNNRVAVFDDSSIRVFQLSDDNEIIGTVSESNHSLGYCPARFFWSAQLNESTKDVKKNPITKELSDFDWLLFFMLSKRHLDTYASYPIYSAYEQDCDFANNETGDYCDGGFLRNERGEYKILRDGSLERCPCCSEKRITGPGSFVEVPIPNTVEGRPDMRSPISITTIDRESLDYNVKEEERLTNKIVVSIVGSGGTVSEKEAINETQVAANFESKTSVLNALKSNFESAQEFVESTICRFRYGNEFISMSVSWGTEFYIFTVAELYDKFKTAKDAGASSAELTAIRQQIVEVEHKNNPIQFARMQILRQLEPYSNKTEKEVLELFKTGLVDKADFMLKLNFESYIDRFERENINIVEFGNQLPMKQKIEIITKKLKQYVSEQKTTPVIQSQSGSSQEGTAEA